MVHIAIENLLSTCNNRPLYEALWFLAFAKNYRPEILENESISSICNELITRIRDENIDARSFVISTNLVFGTVRLYKAQIDKLYDQTKFALQSCKTTFFQMDWIAEMTQATSTPIQPVRAQKTPKQTQKSAKKKSTVAKKSVEISPILDDIDIIESIYKILDNDIEDETLVPETANNRRGSKKKSLQDTGIEMDPTMASDVFAITMKEPSTLMTSGFNTMMSNQEEDGFGAFGNEFEDLLKDTADTVLSQGDVIESNSQLLSTIKSRKRPSNLNDNSEIKKRRLSYMNFDDTLGEARDANANHQVQNIDIYDQIPEHPINDSSTFNENLNVTEGNSREMTNNHSPTINSTADLVPMEITDEPVPQISNNEISEIENGSMQNISANNEQTLVEHGPPIIPVNEPILQESNIPANEPENMIQESELILEEIHTAASKKRARKSKSLAKDKQKIIPKDNFKKSIEMYKDKMTEVSPFSNFLRRVHYFKSCTDVLFTSGSFRLKNSKLHHLYTRNMKKIPEKVLKKRPNTSSLNEDPEIVGETSTPKVPKRSTRASKMIKESPIIEEKMEVDISPPILPIEESPVDDKPRRYYTRSRNALKELNNIEQQVPEIEIQTPKKSFRMSEMEVLSPQIPSTSHTFDKENQQFGVDFELPPVFDKENVNMTMNVDEENENSDIKRVGHKKVVLTKLKELWKQKDRSITMNKVCLGMQRTEAAGAFFEILLLAKYRSIELVQETGSLEISNILCKISPNQLSKELYC